MWQKRLVTTRRRKTQKDYLWQSEVGRSQNHHAPRHPERKRKTKHTFHFSVLQLLSRPQRHRGGVQLCQNDGRWRRGHQGRKKLFPFFIQVSECGAILWESTIFTLTTCSLISAMDSLYSKFWIKYSLAALIGKKLRKHLITNSKNSVILTSASKFASK